ncbi:hypothetical protein [Metapseudomonas otitidis]|uniref:hypothetical protein n=1 Tax=Metapseudomonas otitidis TaxID=319939 RepID=UPI00244CE2BD|nr:hypothetical protein [Pseudomonas otitidis]MDG9783129.1 hypothetical protein [Pseudomonas otitidis]WMR31003.1 hypothetical protein QT513_17555 [Pseudomonas otitidis]
MSNALRKDDAKMERMAVPRRNRDEVVRARPAMGDHQKQVDAAFALAFERYEKAFEALAKV